MEEKVTGTHIFRICKNIGALRTWFNVCVWFKNIEDRINNRDTWGALVCNNGCTFDDSHICHELSTIGKCTDTLVIRIQLVHILPKNISTQSVFGWMVIANALNTQRKWNSAMWLTHMSCWVFGNSIDMAVNKTDIIRLSESFFSLAIRRSPKPPTHMQQYAR